MKWRDKIYSKTRFLNFPWRIRTVNDFQNYCRVTLATVSVRQINKLSFTKRLLSPSTFNRRDFYLEYGPPVRRRTRGKRYSGDLLNEKSILHSHLLWVTFFTGFLARDHIAFFIYNSVDLAEYFHETLGRYFVGY